LTAVGRFAGSCPQGAVLGQRVRGQRVPEARRFDALAAASAATLFACSARQRVRRAYSAKQLTPSSPSQFLGESEVRLSDEDLQRNRHVWEQAHWSKDEGSLFRMHKERILEKTLLFDRSPKGCVDYRIMGILDELNRREEFVTTSSCSGRVLFVSHGVEDGKGEDVELLPGAKSHTGRWRISHDGIVNDPEEYFDLETEPLRDNLSSLWLHVQAMELQVACASAADANRLISVVKKVFQRAYVKSASREWKTLVYVEGSQRIEMPFALSGNRVYCGSVQELAQIVNSKLKKNWDDMDRLLEVLKKDL